MSSTYHATRLEIDPTAYIAPGAALVGEVSVGRNASVWFHVTVRGDGAPVVIGEESNVQDGSVVHVDPGRPTRIGARVTVGHGAIVPRVPEGTLVLGVPGRVVRPLRPEEIERIHSNASSYVELARAYRGGRIRVPGGDAA